MTLSEDQMQRQKDYSATRYALEQLRKQGILSDKEYRHAQALMVKEYQPIIRHIS